MNKLLIAVFVLGIAYFAYHKRSQAVSITEVSADKTVSEEALAKPIQLEVTAARVTVSATVTTSAPIESIESMQENEVTDEAIVERDKLKENVDQTVIANEKKLAGARSSQEVIDLLRQLRFRLKNLNAISASVTAIDYAKFWGSYEGSVVNNRNEVLFGLKINLKAASDTNSKIIGKYQIAKPGQPPTTHEFYDEFSAQLIGRDGLVIGSPDGHHFQLYKLDNGYLAGNYYEKTGRRTKTYRFILKNK